jgi:MOSC domain-containing protein YiiM
MTDGDDKVADVTGEVGRLAGIARRGARRAPMEVVDRAIITAGRGLNGDHKGAKFPNRGVTVLAREAWEEALGTLLDQDGPADLDWTLRRANLLVEGIALPRVRGAILCVGPVLLEVTAQTYPCRRMEEVRAGLMKALASVWRGGVCCRVLVGGEVEIGQAVKVMWATEQRDIRLPG